MFCFLSIFSCPSPSPPALPSVSFRPSFYLCLRFVPLLSLPVSCFSPLLPPPTTHVCPPTLLPRNLPVYHGKNHGRTNTTDMGVLGGRVMGAGTRASAAFSSGRSRNGSIHPAGNPTLVFARSTDHPEPISGLRYVCESTSWRGSKPPVR